MSDRIIVAGATGNLGQRIVKALMASGANPIALVRTGTAEKKIDDLKARGARVEVLDVTDVDQVAKVCSGADCLVSAVAGLQDVIVEGQKIFLEARPTSPPTSRSSRKGRIVTSISGVSSTKCLMQRLSP